MHAQCLLDFHDECLELPSLQTHVLRQEAMPGKNDSIAHMYGAKWEEE